uniref:Complement component 6, duplicate 2 n=1 Tax=Gasterosteus aculeatus aculeatus TaxID=481459 RepID=A0AAQ4NRF8_GASAC
MAASGRLVLMLQLFSWTSVGMACFCDRYPWGSWSACSKTCNHGTQHRYRQYQYDDGYYWKNSCQQLCNRHDERACNEQNCPINCRLTDFGSWSDCSPCAKKQFRTRSVQRPSQFGGSSCSVELTEDRPCYPSTDCKLPPIDCRSDFKCDTGRCINSTLTCNSQNDCGDNSDERECAGFKIVCQSGKRVAPGASRVENGFDALAEKQRSAVLDNMFMGGSCWRVGGLQHRAPCGEDRAHRYKEVQFVCKERKRLRLLIRESKFFRVHQVLPVSTFKVRDPADLVLSQPFLQFLHALPLEYNYALYRDIFQRFGTHYYSAGKLGGVYDLLYQYSREELTSSDCLNRDTAWTAILYTQYSSVTRCSDNRMTEKYHGSYIEAAEKSFSSTRGGRPREAAALVWERQGAAPNKTSYKDWAKSVLDNPDVVEYEVLPIIDLVRGIPCATTKRRHLRKALLQYLEEFDTCKCSPCPNNARPVLSGTECQCLCQTGTFGTNCEKRAPDFTSEVVDGYWSCWGPWSGCGGSMKRHRRRRCDNPAPLRGGQPCEGPDSNEEACHVSIFERQQTCDNDDDFTAGWSDELPPGVQGCRRPQRLANSFLRKAKRYYDFGEDEHFACFTGFELEGFQYINCLPDGSWSQPKGRCIKEPFVPEGGCGLGEKLLHSKCLCIPRESCLSQPESLCILNLDIDVTVPMSLCSFRAGRCHGDPLFFVAEGACDAVDSAKLEWAKFRANMSSKSSVQTPCDLDTCYDWETCSASKTCVCKEARTCPPQGPEKTFCVKLKTIRKSRSMSLCLIAALKCVNTQIEILNEGVCESR